MLGIRRREFITLLGGTAAWPFAARGQQPATPVVGYLSSSRPGIYASPEFLEGLGEVGFVEGRNVVIEYHWANGDYGLFPALAADLVRRRVSAIYVGTTPGALAAKAATTSIPIVFQIGGDPVKLGLVTSMNRPGGKVTGFTAISNALTAKRLELLRDLVPQAETIAFLVNPTNQNAESDTQDVQAAARAIGRRILVGRQPMSRSSIEPSRPSSTKGQERSLLPPTPGCFRAELSGSWRLPRVTRSLLCTNFRRPVS